MAKTQQQELLKQTEIIGAASDPKKGPSGLLSQGFWISRTVDRIKAGRPDLRIARLDLGHLDIELKYCHNWGDMVETGLTGLQWLKIRQMNEAGVAAICLVYVPAAICPMPYFVVTTLLRERLLASPYRVMELPRPSIIDGAELFRVARLYLSENDHANR